MHLIKIMFNNSHYYIQFNKNYHFLLKKRLKNCDKLI